MIIEVCAQDIRSLQAAHQCGISRVELCSALELGGLSPSPGLVQEAIQYNPAVFALVRPRKGDFSYNQREFSVIMRDIEWMLEAGVDGIVSGFLEKNGQVDRPKTKKLVETIGSERFTFHRAIDLCPNPLLELEVLQDLGVKRVLSSGGQKRAVQGLDQLIQMREQAKSDQCVIMPGSGINSQNIKSFAESGFTEVHLSAQQQQPSLIEYDQEALFDLHFPSSSADEIRACQDAINTLSP